MLELWDSHISKPPAEHGPPWLSVKCCRSCRFCLFCCWLLLFVFLITFAIFFLLSLAAGIFVIILIIIVVFVFIRVINHGVPLLGCEWLGTFFCRLVSLVLLPKLMSLKDSFGSTFGSK